MDYSQQYAQRCLLLNFTQISSIARPVENTFNLNLLRIELGEKMLFSLLEMHFDVEMGMMKRAFLQHLQFASVNKGYLPK